MLNLSSYIHCTIFSLFLKLCFMHKIAYNTLNVDQI